MAAPSGAGAATPAAIDTEELAELAGLGCSGDKAAARLAGMVDTGIDHDGGTVRSEPDGLRRFAEALSTSRLSGNRYEPE